MVISNEGFLVSWNQIPDDSPACGWTLGEHLVSAPNRAKGRKSLIFSPFTFFGMRPITVTLTLWIQNVGDLWRNSCFGKSFESTKRRFHWDIERSSRVRANFSYRGRNRNSNQSHILNPWMWDYSRISPKRKTQKTWLSAYRVCFYRVPIGWRKRGLYPHNNQVVLYYQYSPY